MDKLKELKNQLVEQGKAKALAAMNRMLSMIPEIRTTIAELKRVEQEFYKDYPGKKIYFAPKSPTTKEYNQIKKEFFEQLMSFREVYLEVSTVLKSTNRVNDIGVVTFNDGVSGTGLHGFARDYEELKEHSAALKFEEAMKHFFEDEFETNDYGKIKLIDESGNFDKRIIDTVKNAKGLKLYFLDYPVRDILDEDEWDKVVEEVEKSKEIIIKNINKAKEKGYSTKGREKTLEVYLNIEEKIEQIETMELNLTSAPKAKAGDSLSFITENKGKSAGKGGLSKEKSNGN